MVENEHTFPEAQGRRQLAHKHSTQHLSQLLPWGQWWWSMNFTCVPESGRVSDTPSPFHFLHAAQHHDMCASNPGPRSLKAQAAAAWRCSFAPSQPHNKGLLEVFTFLLGQGYSKGGDPLLKTIWAAYSVLNNHELLSKQRVLCSPFGWGYTGFSSSTAECPPPMSIWLTWFYELPVTAEFKSRGSALV